MAEKKFLTAKLGRKIRHSAANKQPYIKKDFFGEKTHFFKGY
jgi:hypothetical protein